MKSIYKITNLITNQLYIGQSSNIERRFYDYKTLNCKVQHLLYNSLLEYKIENHKFEIIATCINELADSLEIYFIKYYKSYYYSNKIIGLNLKLGGRNSKLDIEMRNKISISLTGKTKSEESKNKMTNSMLKAHRIKRGEEENNGSYKPYKKLIEVNENLVCLSSPKTLLEISKDNNLSIKQIIRCAKYRIKEKRNKYFFYEEELKNNKNYILQYINSLKDYSFIGL